jgi:hypothetical protein
MNPIAPAVKVMRICSIIRFLEWDLRYSTER